MESIDIIIGLVVGVIITFILVKMLTPKNAETDTSSLQKEMADKDKNIRDLEIEKARISSELNSALELKNKAEKEVNVLGEKIATISSSEASLKTNVANLEASLLSRTEEKNALKLELTDLQKQVRNFSSEASALKEINKNLIAQQEEIADVEKRFKTEFENISNRLIKQNAETINEKSSNSLNSILNPLKEDLEKFKKNIDDKYVKEAEAKASLKTEIASLIKLNEQLSDDATNLTKALTGNNKHQGNWGEIVLERVLERSGLNKGQEYMLQEHFVTEDGTRRIPDAVIYLPDNKHIIVDSKVSLTAYQRMVNAESIDQQNIELKLHVSSLKSHIKELSDKNYYDHKDYNSPDFTLMFLPIEASFSVALREDTELFNYAWERNIVIVSPTTLLATLRTIESTWKHERQNRNVIEIARIGGTLYDKFEGFVKDMERIEKGLETSQKAVSSAMNKLKTGNGNIVITTQKLKNLGAKAKKSLPSELLEEAGEFIIESSTDE